MRVVFIMISLVLSTFLAALEKVPLDKKIGQMIMVGFRGYEISKDDWMAHQIANGEIGGVILYDFDREHKEYVRNIQSPEQVKKLTQSLKSYTASPLLIMVDQEGGVVNRLKTNYGFPSTISAQQLGQTNDLAVTRQQGELIGKTLAQAGINVNFSPVVDVNTNPNNPIIAKKERSFSANPNLVASHAREFVQGHHKYGVFTTLKHFPGHGSSTADTHEGYVDVTKTWSEAELIPYRSLINSGDADTIMTAHVFNAQLDSKFPGSLSKDTIQGLLREKLKFDGVVISDDLQMGAIHLMYPLEVTVKMAILAGVDILQFSNQQVYDPEIAPKVIQIVKQLIASGEVPLERIEESYRRIQVLKSKLLD